ncbi:MAG: hypothetical protein JNL62_06195, partial [Bryobacterales bacterium]|nr:hypothetical protein [Bryobacterales bacterium]
PYVGTIDGGATPATTFRNPFPNGVAQALGASPGLAAQFGNALTFYNPARVNPYNQQWQFSIQRELPSQTLVDIAYLGMLSLKQFESFNLNEKPDRFLALGTAENTRVPNPFLGIAPSSSTLGQGATIVQSRLWPAYPQYTNLVVQGENTGRAVYHAFQWKVEKRTTRGLSFLWSHTFSKLMDNYTTSIVNTRKFRSVSEFDQTHAMRLAASYALPFRPANRIARGIVSGWEITGFLTHETGTPLTVTHANGRPVRIRNPHIDGPVGDRLGDRREGGRVVNPYFDITAFQPLPNQFTVTPEPAFFSELRAPSTRTLNLTVLKQFPIRERLKFQIRMDAIGATNTPIFGAPGANLSNTATFGVINSAGGSRQMLGSARILF